MPGKTLRTRDPMSVLCLLCGLVGILIAQSGCAILTKSQIEEVNRFAEAAKHYGALPGEPIKQYGALSKLNRLLGVAEATIDSKEEAKSNWQKVNQALAIETQFAADAAEADQAVTVLTEYAEGLQTLTMIDPTEGLDKAAADFGTSLDKAVNGYNTVVRRPHGQSDLKLVGATVAGIVRTTGGIFIRSKQAAYVKSFVTEADPLIEAVTIEIQKLMDKMEGYLGTTQRERLENNFYTFATRRKTIPVDTVTFFADSLEKTNRAVDLSKQAKSGAAALAKAHKQLVMMVSTRRDLQAGLDEIQILIAEVKAGLNVRKQLQ
jgi:hypothetical protein